MTLTPIQNPLSRGKVRRNGFGPDFMSFVVKKPRLGRSAAVSERPAAARTNGSVPHLFRASPDTSGGRSPPGAATPTGQKAQGNLVVAATSGIAAPGCGRTPLPPIGRRWHWHSTLVAGGHMLRLVLRTQPRSGLCADAPEIICHAAPVCFSGMTTAITRASGLRYFRATSLISSSVTASYFASSSSARW